MYNKSLMGNYMSYRRDFGLVVVGAILFTASFLWKDFITEFEEMYFPKMGGIGWRFMFTILVTVILVIIAVEMKDFFGINSAKQKISAKLDEDLVEKNEDQSDDAGDEEMAMLDMAALGLSKGDLAGTAEVYKSLGQGQ
jgi:hypothetical protein